MSEMKFIVELLSGTDFIADIRKKLDTLVGIIPEIRDMIGFCHCHPHHHLDVWEHTLLALSYSENRLETRLALLLHDVGKPHSYQCEGELRHYRGHAEKSAEIAKSALLRVGFDAQLVETVAYIIKNHDTPLTERDITERSDYARALFAVQRCDAAAHNPAYNQKRMAYIANINELMKNK